MALAASWTKVLQDDALKRSSLCASAIGSDLYIFGGELQPRQPRDEHVHHISVKNALRAAHAETIQFTADHPSARVGAASTSLHGKLYMFSGRGGEAMAPIDESGHVWVFDPSASTWSSLAPSSSTEIPEPRSYHCMTNDGHDTLFLHAGCPEQGRLSDLWSFTVSTATWKRLASAPDPPRGGPSVAFAGGKVYRMNGFDGKTEQGGSVDVFDPATNTWNSARFPADGTSGPGARSVSALVPVKTNGDTLLVTLFGESDPSSLGHQGAGKMLNDVWAYSLGSRRWNRITIDSTEIPQARAWFDADVVHMDGKDHVAVVGGLGESNERLSDAWLLSLA